MIALAKRLPWNLIGYILAFVLIVAGINSALGFLPFSPQWSAKRAEAKADRLQDQVSTLTREATGNAEIAAATESYHTTEVIIREGTAQAIAEARSAPDATTPLDPVRADRLRTADNRLCDASPGICADPDASGRGPNALPASDASR